jgi:hypothetical protein
MSHAGTLPKPTVVTNDTGEKVLEWENRGLILFNLKPDPSSTEQVRITLLGGQQDGNENGDALRELALLVQDHESAVSQERARFKGIEQIEDVLALDETTRAGKLGEIDATLQDVAQRRENLWAAIRNVPPPAEGDHDGQALLKKAITYATDIDQHLPNAFMGTSGDSVRRRMATLIEVQGLNATEKSDTITLLKQGFTDENGKDITAQIGEAYRGLIEPALLKPMERSKFYFDKIYVAQNQATVPTNDEGERDGLSGIEATDILVDQCQKILDLGGKFSDVEALVNKTGIPKDWWPDKLVAAMQAWRKTEAALQRAKLAEQFEKTNKQKVDQGATKVPITIEDLKDVVSTYAGTYPDLANQVLKLIDENKDVVEKLKDGLDKLGGGVAMFSGVTSFVELVNQQDDGVKKTASEERDGKIDIALESVSAFGELYSGVFETIVNSGVLDEAMKAFFENQLLPGLSLAKTGIDMIQTGKALVKNYQSKQDATALKKMARTEQGRGGREDGGTFANAMGNEQSAMNKQLAKGGVDMFTHVLAGSGELAGTFGGAHGVVAGVALKITATGISLGSKAIFSGINWAEAKRAKEMVEQARAGNPIAKVEIFKNSNTYAKMYLVQLAKEGDPLAEQFIVSKGISEDNLTTGVAEKILMQALLKASGQEDDAPKEEESEEVNLLRHTKTEEYDPNWTFTGVVELTRRSYDAVKDAAVKHGLANISTGTGAALQKAEAPVATAVDAINTLGPRTVQPDGQAGKAHRDKMQAAIAALGEANGAILGSSPLTARLGKDGKKDRNGKPQTHAGMSAYLATLLEKSRATQDLFERSLRQSGVKNVAWTPPAQGDALGASVWQTNWEDGVLRAGLPQSDAKVGASLAALMQAWLAFKGANPGKPKREAAQAVIDAVETLADGIEACRTAAGDVPAMQTYLMRILAAAGEQHRAAQDALNPGAWSPTTNLTQPMTAQQWSDQIRNATDLGFLGKKAKPGPVADALRALAKAADDWTKARDEKAKLAAENAHALAIAALDQAVAPFRYDLPPLAGAVDQTLAAARETQAGYDEDRGKVTFQTVPGATAAGWKKTLENALAAGALSGGRIVEKAADALAEALEASQKACKAFDDLAKGQPPAYDKARVAAGTAKDAIAVALHAVEHMRGVPGCENAIMTGYLERELHQPLTAAAAEPTLKDALAGKLAGNYQAPGSFTPTANDFRSAIDAAVRNGVMVKPKRDVPPLLGLLLADADRLAQAKTNDRMPQKTRDEYRAGAIETASRLTYHLDQFRAASGNDSWKAYLEAAKDWVRQQLVTIRERSPLEPNV